MATNATNSIDVSSFRSALAYLNKFYELRKKQDPGFSYEVWSAELGYKSRSFLKMIVSGQRNITPDFVEIFCANQKFSKIEKIHFSLMVSHEQAETPSEKMMYLEKLNEHIGGNKKTVIIEDHELFLSSPHIPKLFSLLSFNDIEKTPETLAMMLNLNTCDIEEYLKILESLGLAEKSPETNKWHCNGASFKLNGKIGSIALTNFHNMSLLEAIEAQKIETKLRRFRTLLLPLNESDFESVLLDLEQLVAKSLAKYDHSELEDRRLYKLNFNLYPVAEKKVENRALNLESKN